MSDIQNPGALRPDPAHGPGATGAAKPQPKTAAGAGSPAFHVLLERLQRQASELGEASRSVDDPAGLAGAVDTARASLEDAQSLAQQLLEAFRGAQVRGEGGGAAKGGA